MKLKLNNVRLSFPALWKAETVNGGGEPAYSASFLLSPSDPQVAAINKAIDKVAAEKWPDPTQCATILTAMRKQDKTALHDGDLKSYAGYEGMLYVSARTKVRPLVLNYDKTPLTEADGRPYAGCFVNASITLWAQDNNYGKRVNAQLLGVQFVADGDAFVGGERASADDFESLEAPDAPEFV
jgi:hypothetical protein